MDKEKFWESQRTRAAIGAIILNLLILGGGLIAHLTGLEVPEATLASISASITAITWKWIDGRTKRNTPMS